MNDHGHRLLCTATAALVVLVVGCTGQSPDLPAGPEPTQRRTEAQVSSAPSEPPATPLACRQPCRGRPRVVGSFPTSRAPEASGLAASRRNPGLLYVLDDGPGTSSVLVIRAASGRVAARLAIEGLNGVDTESLAVGPCAGGDGSCLYLGDIGDNLAQRDSVTLVAVAEPRIRGNARTVTATGRAVALRYPDRPHDAEALLVGHDGALGIVTKHAGRRGTGAARLYLADGFTDGTLTKGPRVRLPAPRTPLAAGVLGNVVTGGDAVAGRVTLRTYDALYEFTAPSTEAPLRNFPQWPVRELASPPELQGEAVAYAADDCSLFTVAEDSGALTSLPCR